MKTALLAWRDWIRFQRLTPQQRAIVFYAEGPGDWAHCGAVVRMLTEVMGRCVCYLTSEASDPVLHHPPAGVRAFYIGRGMVRTLAFLNLSAGVMVMTMPDLQTMHIKRSIPHNVHYIYLFHSMISTHMAYRPAAFDYFDTVLCVGPHHTREIRAREQYCGHRPKELVDHGYGRLDDLLAHGPNDPASHDRCCRRVLIAPSWGPRGLLETAGEQVVGPLLSAGLEVTVRPHPMTLRTHRAVIEALTRRFGVDPRFSLQTSVRSADAFYNADVMISDWSGAALEYAFGLLRPVLYLDVPRKINNHQYRQYGAEPLEVTVREHIGTVVSPDHLAALPDQVDGLFQRRSQFAVAIREQRRRWVFNLGGSAAVGAACIAERADQRMEQLECRSSRRQELRAAT